MKKKSEVCVVSVPGGWKVEIPGRWIAPNSPPEKRSRSLRTYNTKNQAQRAARVWRRWKKEGEQ